MVSTFLWPGESLDVGAMTPCDRLTSSLARFKEWHQSAARAGSKKALEAVFFGYKDAKLD